LLWALRDAANLTGTKQGCGGTGQCGACTVIVDGSAALSCTVPIGIAGRRGRHHHRRAGRPPADLALVAEDAIQCGFCLPGFTCAVRHCCSKARARARAARRACQSLRLRDAVAAAAGDGAGAGACAPVPSLRSKRPVCRKYQDRFASALIGRSAR
jgi:isoquinoline 1-oxidoreductase alpha subunit